MQVLSMWKQAVNLTAPSVDILTWMDFKGDTGAANVWKMTTIPDSQIRQVSLDNGIYRTFAVRTNNVKTSDLTSKWKMA